LSYGCPLAQSSWRGPALSGALISRAASDLDFPPVCNPGADPGIPKISYFGNPIVPGAQAGNRKDLVSNIAVAQARFSRIHSLE
jgi:hypothetical protein